MRNIIITIAFLLGYISFAQEKNSLLEKSFWTKNTNIASVKAEIEKGNNPSELNAKAYDPVSLAIIAGAPNETIKFLLEQEGNYIDKRTHDSRTYLHWAAFSGNEELVSYLISKGFDINITDYRGMSPLTFAAERSLLTPTLCEIFFKAGINPLQKYKNGETLLFISIPNENTNFTLTNYLISKGLSLYDIDKNGNSVFDYATKKGNIALLKKLIEKNIKPTKNAILFAAEGARRFSNKLEVYEYLINDLKIDAKYTNSDGKNALHYIVSKENQEDIVKLFLTKKINVNQIDKDGNTPFILAGNSNNSNIIQLLLPKVKNINQVNNKGISALTNAVRFGTPEVVDFLLKNKANFSVKDKEENTLAYYWAYSFDSKKEKDFIQKKELLLTKNIDFTKPQKEGNTLLHIAVIENNFDLLQKIVDLKINPNIKNNEGETALHKAAMVAKDDSILRFLIAYGADKKILTDFEETAYDLAKDNEILQQKNINIDFLK